MKMVMPQIGELGFILATSGVALDIFSSFEAGFLLGRLWLANFITFMVGVLHYPVLRYRTNDPLSLPPN